MDEQLIILKKFPFLVPQNGQFTEYDGYISAGRGEFLISLKVPRYPLLENISINLPWYVHICLENCNRGVDKWKGNCTSLRTFLECLQSEVEESTKSEFAKLLFRSGNRMPVEFYENFVESMGYIDAKNICSISSNLEKIELTVHDISGNCHEHLLIIQYNIAEPNSPPCIQADLPANGMRKLESVRDKGLIGLFTAFKEMVVAFSDFWNVLDEMDQKCWIILPEQPRKCDTFRRIALGHHVSLVVTLDPSCIQKVPELNFFGPEEAVEHLVKKMQENISGWPKAQSFVDSLQLLLGVVFPTNPEKGVGNSSCTTDMECMICCSVLLAGETPTEACGNRCGAVYHAMCISQWLVAVMPCNDSSMTIQGKCPSCNIGTVKVSTVKQ